MVNRARDAFRFLVELEGIEPRIWREVEVPARYTFWDLHVAIQDAMGWQDYHLHEFRIQLPDDEIVVGIPGEDDDLLPYEVLPGWHVPLADVLSETGQGFRYLYDFGDEWEHEVTLLGSSRREKGVGYPRCIDGEQACPPEDCGGAPGYFELLHALADVHHPEHAAMREWIPRGWAPGRFDATRVHFDNPGRRWRRAFAGS